MVSTKLEKISYNMCFFFKGIEGDEEEIIQETMLKGAGK